MEWYVYVFDINKQEIQKYNIFKHYSVNKEINDLLNSNLSKEEFEYKLDSILRYYFWCKAEWEIVIKPWVGGKDNIGIKIDVYQQIKMNWKTFFDMVTTEFFYEDEDGSK